MEADLEKFHRLRNEGYRLTKQEISVNQSTSPSEVVKLTLKKNDKEMVFSSSDPELCSYVAHLMSVPHFEDDDSDFVYVKDTEKYFDIQRDVINLLSGETKNFVIHENFGNLSEGDTEKIISFQRKWILSEKGSRVSNTRLCQIFYDVCILIRTGRNYNSKILSKETITLEDIHSIIEDSTKSDLAICFSACIASPKVNSETKQESDVIIGLIVYDLKNRQILSLNINSLGQFQRKISNIGQFGLWECVYELFNRTQDKKCFKSYLPVPINLRDYTPLPWFCVAFLKGIKEEIILSNIKFDMPLFLVFGTPLLMKDMMSYDFEPKKQRALMMLEFRDNNEQFIHQVRFDMSRGEPNLHIDYEIFPENGSSFKCVGHSVVNYKDIWEFSENLAIGFLLASSYDINFEKLVVPTRLDGISEAFKNNPVTTIPLFVRSMASKPFRVLKENNELLETFSKLIIRKEKCTDKDAIRSLHELGLLHNGRLTILGDIIKARILQTTNN
jgi:hypothetical protein